MNTVASIILILLLVVMFQQYVNGTLGQWMRAKFLNQA